MGRDFFGVWVGASGGCGCWWGMVLGVSGYVSVAMTLDVCADLFGGDLDVLGQCLGSVAWLYSV